MSDDARPKLLTSAIMLAAGGVLVGVAGGWALLIVLGLAVGLLVVRWPIVGVVFFAASIPLENLVVVGGSTLPRLLGMAVFAGWVLHKILFRESWKALARNPLLLPATLFIGLAAFSMLWAREPQLSRSGVIQLIRLLAMALLLLDVLDGWKKLEWAVRVLVISAVAASLITLYQYHFVGLMRAGVDVSGNVNATAMLLVTLVPFSFYMFRSSQSAGWRLLGCVSLAISIAAVAVTLSRMSLLLLPPLLAAQSWHTIGTRRGTGWLLAVGGAAAIVATFTIPWRAVEKRASTILPYIEATINDPGGRRFSESSARAYHLRVGMAIFADHPILGVGYDNYGDYFIREYQFELEGGSKLWTKRRSAHSSNIAVLADLGLIGLALWILLLGVGLVAVFKAWRTMRRVTHHSDGFFLVQAVTYSYVLQALAYTWYGNSQKEKIFWLVLAASVIVYELALKTTGSLEAAADERRSEPINARPAPALTPLPGRG